jgi:hypothetical protein
MGYRLFAIPAAGLDWRPDGQLIGEFRQLEQAERARDADVLNQLREHGGWRIKVSHAIIDRDGAEVELDVTTLGVRPDREWPPDGDDLAEHAAWLAAGPLAPMVSPGHRPWP